MKFNKNIYAHEFFNAYTQENILNFNNANRNIKKNFLKYYDKTSKNLQVTYKIYEHTTHNFQKRA